MIAQIVLWIALLGKTIHFGVNNVLEYCERRDGVMCLRDPVFEHLPIVDLTRYVNLLQHFIHFLYAPNVLYLMYHCDESTDWPVTMLSFILIIASRMLCIYLTPFETPNGHIHLEDSLQNVLTARKKNYDRDLFFSGHVSVLVVCGLTFKIAPELSWLFFLSAFVQSIMLLLSRIHYTIDVFVAPFMSYGCYSIAKSLF